MGYDFQVSGGACFTNRTIYIYIYTHIFASVPDLTLEGTGEMTRIQKIDHRLSTKRANESVIKTMQIPCQETTLPARTDPNTCCVRVSNGGLDPVLCSMICWVCVTFIIPFITDWRTAVSSNPWGVKGAWCSTGCVCVLSSLMCMMEMYVLKSAN